MATTLSNISGHVPVQVKDRNYLVKNFLALFDAMHEEELNNLDYFRRSFLPQLAQELRVMRWWVDTFAGEYNSETTLEALDCFYWNSYYIYSRKGTKNGLERLLNCLVKTSEYATDVEVSEFVCGKPLILFDLWRPFDQLPNGVDLAAELDSLEPKYVPTILGGSWEEHKHNVTITFDLDGNTLSDSYEDFLKEVMRKYCPAIGEHNLIIEMVYL